MPHLRDFSQSSLGDFSQPFRPLRNPPPPSDILPAAVAPGANAVRQALVRALRSGGSAQENAPQRSGEVSVGRLPDFGFGSRLGTVAAGALSPGVGVVGALGMGAIGLAKAFGADFGVSGPTRPAVGSRVFGEIVDAAREARNLSRARDISRGPIGGGGPSAGSRAAAGRAAIERSRDRDREADRQVAGRASPTRFFRAV